MPLSPNRLPSMLEQAALFVKEEQPGWPLNPFPSGPREGKCTNRVLDELKRVYPQHLEHGQLRMNLGLSRGAVCWALRYLESRGMIARVHDPRNPQYRRWRAVLVAE